MEAATSGNNSLLPYGIVSEPSFSGLAADCPLLKYLAL